MSYQKNASVQERGGKRAVIGNGGKLWNVKRASGKLGDGAILGNTCWASMTKEPTAPFILCGNEREHPVGEWGTKRGIQSIPGKGCCYRNLVRGPFRK